MRKRTVNTHPALPQQPHPQVPKPATCHSPPPLVFTHPLAVISPNWHVERPMRRPIAFRPTCSQVLAVPVCSNVCTPLPPGYAWLLRPCPLVWHAILKGDRALPSGVGPADRGQGGGDAMGRGGARSPFQRMAPRGIQSRRTASGRGRGQQSTAESPWTAKARQGSFQGGMIRGDGGVGPAPPPPPCVTFRRVAVSLRVARSSLRGLRRVAVLCRPL